MEETSEDETVEIFTKAIRIINKDTISRLSFVIKYNEWSKRFETSFNNLTKTKENLWLTVSPNRYLQFSITSIIVLCFLESIRCKSTPCCLTGFATVSFLIIWTFLVASFGNLSKRDGAISSVIIYVGSLANLCQILTNKLNRTRQLLKIIAGPNFLHTIPDCYKSQEKLQLNILLRSWLRLCLSWVNVWGIIFGVQISVILYVFEFREYLQLFQSVSGLLIMVGIFSQITKIKRCRLEMQQTRKILESITFEYFQWFEKKCALRALIMKSEYFDLNWQDIFHHRFDIFQKNSIHSQLMYSLIIVGMAYGLRHETREAFLADAVRFLLFNKRPKRNSSSQQIIQKKERTIPHDNLKNESKSCFYYLNILKNWLTSQKLTSSIPSEVPKSEKSESNKEIVKFRNHEIEFKKQIEENVNETTFSQTCLEGKMQEKSECPKVEGLENNYSKVEDKALDINEGQPIMNTLHVTKDCLPPETLKQDVIAITNDNTEIKDGIKPDNLSNADKPVNITILPDETDAFEFARQVPPLVNIKHLEEKSNEVEFAEQIPLLGNIKQLEETGDVGEFAEQMPAHGNIENLEEGSDKDKSTEQIPPRGNIKQLDKESDTFAEPIPPQGNIEQLEPKNEEFVDDTKIDNQLLVLKQALESNTSLRSQETTNTHVLNRVSEVCEQAKFFNIEKLNENISRDIYPSSSHDADVLSLNELESLANTSNKIENTQECCHFEWMQLKSSEIAKDNFMNGILGNSECCRIFNQYQMSEEFMKFINYGENEADILSQNNTFEFENNCQFIWNPSQNLANNTEVDSKVNIENDNINTNLSNNYSTKSYGRPTSSTVFETLDDSGITEDKKCNTPTDHNFKSEDFRRIQVSENENVSRNKMSPVFLSGHYDAECNDELFFSDGIFSSSESEMPVSCDSNANKECTNNFQIEAKVAGSIEEVIHKLESEEKTTEHPKNNCSQNSQHSTEQNEVNFLNAKDRRKYTRRENFKCYAKRTSRKGNQKCTGARQQHTVHVLENYDDPEVQPTGKNASEVLEEKDKFEFFIENSIQNNDKINPFTDFENQRPTKNEYFTGCSSFSSGVLYTEQSNHFSEQPNHFYEQPNHFYEQPNHFYEQSNNFSEQSNIGEQALYPQDSADDEESSTHSEPSPKPQKTKFRWISDEKAILDPQNDDNIIPKDLHDNSFVDEENAQPIVNATEPITYSLKCGNMNLEFTENSPRVSLRFICESNEDVIVHKAPKRIISKTFSDEEEFMYPETDQNNEESYDSDFSQESSATEFFSETTMCSNFSDSDRSSLMADDHVNDIPLTRYKDTEEVPLTEHNGVKRIPLAGDNNMKEIRLTGHNNIKEIPLTGRSRVDKVPFTADDPGHDGIDKVPFTADDPGHDDIDKVPFTADDPGHDGIDKVPFTADDPGHDGIDKVPLTGHGNIEKTTTSCGKAALVDSNVNQDLHFEMDNVKLNFVPTPSSGTLEVDYRQSYKYNSLIFKSNDKKLKLKIKK